MSNVFLEKIAEVDKHKATIGASAVGTAGGIGLSMVGSKYQNESAKLSTQATDLIGKYRKSKHHLNMYNSAMDRALQRKASRVNVAEQSHKLLSKRVLDNSPNKVKAKIDRQLSALKEEKIRAMVDYNNFPNHVAKRTEAVKRGLENRAKTINALAEKSKALGTKATRFHKAGLGLAAASGLVGGVAFGLQKSDT